MLLAEKLQSRDPEVRKVVAEALQGTRITDPQAADYLAMVQRRL
jgi:hypothetical protein